MDRLLSIIPWYYRWLAFAALVAAAMAFGAAKMHQHDSKAMDKLMADYAKAEAEAAARDAERKKASDRLIKEKDDERETQLADAHRWWSAYVERLQHGGGPGPARKPVPIVSQICNDPARDNELSAAVARFRLDTRAAIAEYRGGVAPLLRAAEVQTGDLINLQDAWAKERLIHGE